ncbi:MAG: DNA-3-methyladenine glycosylase I [Rhodospirillales bacterium]|mgnify:FL=1|jgi:DNA-3-methyladenine glycosylase I|nr:DNA-3-methyladenine glycosylase I [Rhodospirillales bacterium]MBT4005974.1 DNA-3-methyladenine glycosylase I [Rhodospirillales bacterium]MBT5076764.1 DNA-3-methyladenine glycosylase I [Rhodospirillales bacterium]MBT5112717.1 DNA-3-methyladenine glycosylase I [Rhodospirillales bacterium]MBT5673487.1 DNA-3-methyladenine glycosylase I [Rhodospirillales bacterium]
MSYCETSNGHPIHGPHHDDEYGRPVSKDAVLFERMALEINQAGLSWLLILKKREALFDAFEGFDLARVAAYGNLDISRLMGNAGIIRNRRKIDAVIENARRLCVIKETHGGFKPWLDAHHPLTLPEWVKLMRKTFVFMGPEVVNEFMMSTGYLPGAHDADCPIAKTIAKLSPPWMCAAPEGGW